MAMAPRRPTRAPSKTNGQRMKASEAPTRPHDLDLLGLPEHGEANRVDDDEQHDGADDPEQEHAERAEEPS